MEGAVIPSEPSGRPGKPVFKPSEEPHKPAPFPNQPDILLKDGGIAGIKTEGNNGLEGRFARQHKAVLGKCRDMYGQRIRPADEDERRRTIQRQNFLGLASLGAYFGAGFFVK